MLNSGHSETLLITGPAGELQVAVEAPTRAAYAVTFVMCHPHPLFQGTMDNKVVTTVTKMFNRLGVKTVRFNYRGVGQSEGSYDRGIGETQDALAVINWAQQQDPNHQIWLGGFSFGGYVAYRAAGCADIKQLLTLSPGVASHDVEGLPEPSMPWVVVHSQADEITPIGPVLDWLAKHDEAYDFIKLKEASHFFHGQLITLRNKLAPIYQVRLPSQN